MSRIDPAPREKVTRVLTFCFISWLESRLDADTCILAIADAKGSAGDVLRYGSVSHQPTAGEPLNPSSRNEVFGEPRRPPGCPARTLGDREDSGGHGIVTHPPPAALGALRELLVVRRSTRRRRSSSNGNPGA